MFISKQPLKALLFLWNARTAESPLDLLMKRNPEYPLVHKVARRLDLKPYNLVVKISAHPVF